MADVKITQVAGGQKATPVVSDRIEMEESGGTSVWATLQDVQQDVFGEYLGTQNGNIVKNPHINSTDTTCIASLISGGGNSAGTGSTNPEGTKTSLSNEIGAGSGYVAGTADYSTISGGYDNLNDQLTGTIAGGSHHWLDRLGDHGTIVGGSTHQITGSGVAYATIVGGQTNAVSHAYSTIIGGQDNQTADSYSVGLGTNSKAFVRGGLTFSGRQIAEIGDAQSFVYSLSRQTTDATQQSMWAQGTANSIDFDNVPELGTFELMVVGRAYVCGVTAAGGYVAWTTNFWFQYDGTTEIVATPSGTTPDFETSLVDTITVAAAPEMSASGGGLLRIKVNGAAATTINWSGRIDGTVVVVQS